MTFRLVRELADDGVPVAVACRVLGVSTSGFYDSQTRPPSAREVADAELVSEIRAIHQMSRGTYGAPRVHDELRLGQGRRLGRKRVARLMRREGLTGVHRRRSSRHRPLPAVHDDLVQRRFRAEEPNRLWVTDITQHPTREGWVYCAVVLDVFSRRVVGWSIADHLRTELVVDALDMARWRRRPPTGQTVVHSDRGTQYTSWAFGHRLRSAGLDRLGQRAGGELLRLHAARAARPQDLGHPHRARERDLRVDRGLVQPAPPAHRHRQSQPR